MGRSRGRSSSPSRGMMGRKPAARVRSSPARNMSTNRSAPPPAQRQQTTPSAQAPAAGGGLLGTMVSGMAFGTGSAVAHQAVGAAAGATSGGGEASQALPGSSPDATQSGPCLADMAAFQKCIKDTDNQLLDCQFFFDTFNACKQDHHHSTLSSNALYYF